ncbi:MAG: HAMP domain-containing protein [Deltaproteobacteria bacterium]|nr:MAG: HAMP domain-containing protein [Deltaproteobacteria bacterium]
MTLRSKLTLMFLGAMQVAFLTAVGTFWAVQSWQLLADDLTVIQEQNLRLERTLEVPVPRAPGEATARQPIHSRTVRSFLALRHHAQTLEEADLIESLGSALGLPSRRGGRRAGERAAPPSSVPDAAGRLKRFYRAQMNALHGHARFVTRLSTGLVVAIVGLVLAGMMAYFAAIRVWLVRPLQAIGRATGVISTGDLEHRVPVAGRDEFGALARSINSMAASLAENQRRLLAAERFAMVGEMAAYVAHNIRNPLASIRTTAQAEMLDLPAEDPRRASFRDIVTATDRLESWVGDLLRFSSPVTLERTPESVNDLVERCADLARPQLTQRRLRLDLTLAPALAPVSLDRNKMEQVVSVLLGNAMDASPAGATIRIISLVRRPDHAPLACIRVEDEGKGIPQERLGKLFTLFATGKKSGTGLGLALAQKIVTAHDGAITVTSNEGAGTAVEISLPVAEGSTRACRPS